MAATVAVLGRDALCPSWPTRGRSGKARHEERPTSAGERQQVEFCLHLSDALELHVERRAQRGHLQRLRVKAHGELLECHQRGLGHDAPRVSAGEGAPPEWLGGQLQSLTGERSAGLFRFAQLSQEAHSICNLRTRHGREQRRQALQPGRDGAEIGSEHLRRRLSHTVRAYGDATDCFVSASLASGLTHCLH